MINIHIDVDNLWMYEKEFDIAIYPDREYIYSQSLPIFLDLLRKSKSKATFMVIGQDLLLPAARTFCKKATFEGHEIANHTWSHPISFKNLSYEQKKQQIVKTHQLITEICGVKPVGFRGPGYYQDREIITILKKINYQYDASVLPGFAQLFMNTYALIRGGKNRYKTFGRINYLFSKDLPSHIKYVSSAEFLELPISILPILRLPIHTTFAYYFGSLYRKLILKYLKTKPKYVLYLLHAIDFVDLPQQKNHPVIPLQYTFKQRIDFIKSILESLIEANNAPLKTSSDNIKLSNLR